MLPRQAIALDFEVPHVVDPPELSPVVLVMVEVLIGFDAGQHPHPSFGNQSKSHRKPAETKLLNK